MITVQRITKETLSDVIPLFDQYMMFYQQPSDTKKYQQFLADRIANNEAMINISYSDNKAVGRYKKD